MPEACGTGDSGREAKDHTGDGWRKDAPTAIQFSGPAPVVATRSLVFASVSQMALDSDGLLTVLVWRSDLIGQFFFNQMLRICVAADLADPNGIERTDDLREVLPAGDCIARTG